MMRARGHPESRAAPIYKSGGTRDAANKFYAGDRRFVTWKKYRPPPKVPEKRCLTED